jgi:hypothetical protein
MTNRSLITSKLLFIIQCMIENALLHSILDTIFKQIKQRRQVLQDDNLFDPLCRLIEIKKWESTKRQSE